jgi:hypothetical protein
MHGNTQLKITLVVIKMVKKTVWRCGYVQCVRKGHSRQKDEKNNSGDYLLYLCSETFVFASGVYANSTRSNTGNCCGSSLYISEGLPLTEFYNGASTYIVVVAFTFFAYQSELHLRRYPITYENYISLYQSITRLFTYPPMNKAIYLPLNHPIYILAHPFIYLPNYLPTYIHPDQFTHLTIDLFTT